MTYRFFSRFFTPRTAACITALWFALLCLIMLVLSGYGESPFMYLDF
jgi:hypothetical protein